MNTKENHLKHQGIFDPSEPRKNTGKIAETPANTKEFPWLVKTKENQNTKEKKIRESNKTSVTVSVTFQLINSERISYR